MNPPLVHLLAAAQAAADQEAGREAERLRGLIVVQLSSPGTGRSYLRGTIIHIASAPGQSPAVDTSRLRQSMHVTKIAPGHYQTGTNVVYAPGLEYGRSNVAPRPFMRPALAKARRT
jgi:hypothetical protein